MAESSLAGSFVCSHSAAVSPFTSSLAPNPPWAASAPTAERQHLPMAANVIERLAQAGHEKFAREGHILKELLAASSPEATHAEQPSTLLFGNLPAPTL
jgi:hypothetical protein